MVKTISKNTINTIRQLHSVKQRHESGLFIVEGEKIVDELLRTDFKIRLIACLNDYFEQNSKRLNGFDINLVNENELSRISLLQTPNQVLALVEMPVKADVNLSKNGIYLMLDGIRDPGNMGTMIRTAEWFGVNAIVCSSDCVDVFSPKVVQGSMGSIFRMPFEYGDLKQMVERFKSAGPGIVLGAILGGASLQSMNLIEEKVMLVIGSEAAGIGKDLLPVLDESITISGAPGSATESLNAAIACGILLHELAGKK